MLNKTKILIIMLSLLLMITSGCAKSSDKLSSKDEIEQESNKAENVTDVADDVEVNQDEETSTDSDEISNDEGGVVSNETDSDLSKAEYLEKLNQMEEADREVEAGSTIAELEEQEDARYHKWDDELNQIYRVLTEQLSDTDMDDLREEQREWIVFRDESAKEESLKYQGGTTEALEYTATQATLTRERCYLLVAQYLE